MAELIHSSEDKKGCRWRKGNGRCGAPNFVDPPRLETITNINRFIHTPDWFCTVKTRDYATQERCEAEVKQQIKDAL